MASSSERLLDFPILKEAIRPIERARDASVSVAGHQVEITRISHAPIHDDHIRHNDFLE